MLARRGVDAHDPQPPEIALLAAPADERIFQRGVDRFFRGTIQLALVGVVPFRQAKQLLTLGPPNCSSLHPRHCFSLAPGLQSKTRPTYVGRVLWDPPASIYTAASARAFWSRLSTPRPCPAWRAFASSSCSSECAA